MIIYIYIAMSENQYTVKIALKVISSVRSPAFTVDCL